MDTRNLLSRRSMLKGSTLLATAVAIAPMAAQAAPELPAVLTLLLSEYQAAAKTAREAKQRFEDVRLAKAIALNKAQIFAQYSDGSYLRLGDMANSYHPENVANLLAKDQKKALALVGGDSEGLAAVRRRFAALRRNLARQRRRFEAVEASFDFDAASHAGGAAETRFNKARDALQAYPLSTMAEVAAILRVVSGVGSFVGWSHGLQVYDLSDMLDLAGAA